MAPPSTPSIKSLISSLVTLQACLATASSSSGTPLEAETLSKRAQATWPSISYKTQNFTSPVFSITRNGTNPTSHGLLFFDPAGSGTTSQAPLITTDDGELVWHGPSSFPTSASANNYQNFRVAELNGQSVLSYWYGYSLATFGHGYGSVAILDQTYTQIYNVCVPNDVLQINTGTNLSVPCYHDQHESYVTDRGTVITSAYNVTQTDLTSVGGPSNGWILDGIFNEINITNNALLFTWRSLDHLDKIPLTASHQPLGAAGRNSSNPWDYFHINSIQPQPDGNYLVNARHIFSTYLVSPNGTILWTLNGATGGDFTLDPDVYFSWQHFPRIVNQTATTLTIDYFNNDNAGGQFNGTNSTTGLELLVDTQAMHVSLVKKFWNPQDLLWADSQGDTQLIDGGEGHYLMGYGQLPVIREYDNDANLIYQAEFGPIAPTLPPVTSYRAYKYNFTGTPSYPPTVVILPNSNGTNTLYVSWNGATDISAYTISTGSSAGNLAAVATIPTTGFETSYLLGGTAAYVQVQALRGNVSVKGGASAVVKVSGAGGNATASATASSTASASASSTVVPYKGAAAAGSKAPKSVGYVALIVAAASFML